MSFFHSDQRCPQCDQSSRGRSPSKEGVIQFWRTCNRLGRSSRTTCTAATRLRSRSCRDPSKLSLDIHLHARLISSYSMSGKSTYLRQIGLLTVMALSGCFVPAEYASFRSVLPTRSCDLPMLRHDADFTTRSLRGSRMTTIWKRI